MNIIEQLVNQHQFSSNEKTIANYMLEKKDDILHLSIQELASKTFTSSGAIMRLCKRIGLSGFKEFKIRFAIELEQQYQKIENIDANFPFKANDSIPEIITKIKQLTDESLAEAHHYLTNSTKEVRQAAKLLQQANASAIFGSGDAFLVGMSFQTRMMRAGINFLVTSVSGEQIHLAQSLKQGDCALLLSYSGTTTMTVNCATILKKNHVHTICITSDANSPLAKISDIALILPPKEKKFARLANFSSHACMEFYTQVLYATIFVNNYEKLKHIPID